MIKIIHKGNFKNIDRFLSKVSKQEAFGILDKYGQIGVDALAASTPFLSGATAGAWSYEIEQGSTGYSIYWSNSNVNNGVNIALILQTGHGTGTGGFVQGRDYINPAIRPIFDQMANAIWSEITSS